MPVRAWKATHQKPNRFPFAKSPKPARKGGTGFHKVLLHHSTLQSPKRSQNARKPFSAQSPREPVERNKTRQNAFYCTQVISWVLRTGSPGRLEASTPIIQTGLISQIREIREMRIICFFAVGSETCAACGAKTRLAGGCAHCVNTTTFPNFFDRCVGNKKSEPLKGPHDFRLPMVKFSPFLPD